MRIFCSLLIVTFCQIAGTGKIYSQSISAPEVGSAPDIVNSKPKACEYEQTRIGNPSWKIGEVGQFVGPSAGFLQVASSIFPSELPGWTPHLPPYDSEVEDGIMNAGYSQVDHVLISEFVATKNVYLAFTFLPGENAPIGTAKDFPVGLMGPIIPTNLFPVVAKGILYKDGVVFDAELGVDYSDKGMIHDGASHAIGLFSSGYEFMPSTITSVEGEYSWEITITDSQSEGWKFKKCFVVF